jgi:hypothetical protein
MRMIQRSKKQPRYVKRTARPQSADITDSSVLPVICAHNLGARGTRERTGARHTLSQRRDDGGGGVGAVGAAAAAAADATEIQVLRSTVCLCYEQRPFFDLR